MFDFVALSFSPQVYPVGSFSNMGSFLPAKEWILHVVWFFGSKTISIKGSTKNIWSDYFAWESSDDWLANLETDGTIWLKTLMILILLLQVPFCCVHCIMFVGLFRSIKQQKSTGCPPTSDCVWWPITPCRWTARRESEIQGLGDLQKHDLNPLGPSRIILLRGHNGSRKGGVKKGVDSPIPG